MMKINYFPGDLNDISAEKAALLGVGGKIHVFC